MGKFDGILLCSDLDGTLLKNDKSISQENIDAIEYFKKEGGRFTFVTGRIPSCVLDICKIVQPNAPIGCINGGGLYDYSTMDYVWKQELPQEVMLLVEYIDENLPHVGIQVDTFEKIYFSKDNSAMQSFRVLTKAPNIIRHYKDVKEPISKIIFASMEKEDIVSVKEMLAAHPLSEKFDFVHSERTLYEILPKGIGKGVSVSKLVQLYDIDVNKTIAIGDYYNDISMFNTAKIGIAVSNAYKDVQDTADYVTVSNEEHAVARVIHDLENGRFPIQIN